MLSTILRWLAIIMMLDSGIAMLGLPFWQSFMPNINIQRIAMIEAILAVLVLVLSFLIA